MPFCGHALELLHPHINMQKQSPHCLAAVLTLCCRLQKIARAIYSNPPLHGALLVSTILNDEKLKQQWYKVCAVAACSRCAWHSSCWALRALRAAVIGCLLRACSKLARIRVHYQKQQWHIMGAAACLRCCCWSCWGFCTFFRCLAKIHSWRGCTLR